MTDVTGETHDWGDEVLLDSLALHASGSADDPGNSDSDSGTFWALVDAGIFGDPEDVGGMDLLDPEECPEGTPASNQESALAAIRHLQVTERRRKVLSGRIGITEEDFEEGPQREAFKLLRQRCRDTFLKNVKPDDRERALAWIFTPIEDPVAFDTCCIALDARPERLQLRLMYEFFRNWVRFPAPLPFLAVPLPEDVTNQLLYVAGEPGVIVAATIWRWPGILEATLINEVSDRLSQDAARRALALIDETGVVQCYVDSWYVTGKRPKPKTVWK